MGYLSLTGEIVGETPRGRQTQKFLDEITADLGNGSTAGKLLQAAKDRS